MRHILIIAVTLLGVTAFFCSTGYAGQTRTSKRAETAIVKKAPELGPALENKGLQAGAPVFLRIVKTSDGESRDGYLEAFVQSPSGDFRLFKKWDICTWSGELGPKLREGDGQSPEGFYFVTPGRMNSHSSYHLSFNLGYPNAFDRAHGRTGSFLMVHGKCVSIGCYAMTDDGIEEIYTLLHAAFDGGQPFVRVHIFPFPMMNDNLERYKDHSHIEFWENLKAGWDKFETDRRPPNVEVHEKTYIFDAG